MQNIALNKHFYAISGSQFVECIHCGNKVNAQGLAKLFHLYECARKLGPVAAPEPTEKG